jgi:hypothetical protein
MVPMRWMAALALAGSLAAQPVAPARAGLISYTEGNVTVDGRAVWVADAHYPEVPAGGVLRTEAGRAEVLLAPCAALRLAENSSFRLVANAVAATRVELLSGSAIVEVGRLERGAALTVTVGETAAPIAKTGSYRFETGSPSAVPVKLGKKPADAFESWNAKRSTAQAKAAGVDRQRLEQSRAVAAAANAAASLDVPLNPDSHPSSAKEAGLAPIFARPSVIGARALPGCAAK